MVARFQLDAPLPESTLLLESSAGTGKTFTIAALAVRFIVERDVPIGRMLMITFSTKAAAELRSRVFATIQSCADTLRAHVAGAPIPDDHPVARHVACLGDVDTSLKRLQGALDEFDQAMIQTTHSFSQWALMHLGILGDADQAERLGAASALIDECTADVYLRLYAHLEEPPFDFTRALWLGRKAADTTLPLAPMDAPEVEFGLSVRDEFSRRKREQGILTFDDLITRLRDVLRHKDTGQSARAWLQQHFDVVLVDEFQDTDPQQWQVIRSAFIAEGRPTVLIGDPKQSIYGFRNADIVSYVQARSQARVETLGANHRSDEGIVKGVVELMEALHLGDESIAVTPVTAKHPSRFECPPRQRVWIRRVDTLDNEQAILDDIAVQVRHILDTTIEQRPTTPSDIAILARTSANAEAIAQRLAALGFPVQVIGGQSVLRQPAACDWRRFLQAMSPSDGGMQRVAGLTDLVGGQVAELATTAGATRISDLMRRAASALTAEGPSAALEVIRQRTALDARLLGTPDGARYVTDLAHVAELLDATGERDPLALLPWLDPDKDDTCDSGLRLSTDAPAIKVMTLHSAKGLEFPVVLLPDLSPLRLFLNRPFTFVEDGRRCLWMRAEHRDSPVGRRAAVQVREEELRLLYVGLTRAKHLAIAWHANDPAAEQGPLSAVLLRSGEQSRLEESYAWSTPRSFTHVLISDVSACDQPPRLSSQVQPPDLPLRRATRSIDHQWRRTSYTGLTQDLHDAPAGADEPQEALDVAPDEALAAPAPMGSLPAGAAFGTLVHEVLEALDWSRDGLRERIATVVSERAVAVAPEDAAALIHGLEAVALTPLLPLAPCALADIPVQRRLPELEFDLPMADRAGASVADLAALLAEHLPTDDPLASYPARLQASPAAERTLTGMLTGSIDAVLELDDGSFVVVDYKTNRLAGRPGDELTLGHYAPAPLAQAMMAAHYPLQAILYCAALHRYLTLRLPNYDPARHLGGVGYLFVRGMAGPDTPRVNGATCGVFTWRPAPSLIVAVSDLLGGSHA